MQFTTGSGCVHAFGQRSEANSAVSEKCHCFHQMLHGSVQAVEFPDHKRVASAQKVQGIIQAGRSALTPEMTSSNTVSQPADLSASTCGSRFWSVVETRAYRPSTILNTVASTVFGRKVGKDLPEVLLWPSLPVHRLGRVLRQQAREQHRLAA